MQGHIPPAGCPGWCSDHAHGMHATTQTTVDGIHLQMLQHQDNITPVIYINGCWYFPLAALDLSRVFARLGHPELAALVSRMAETALADPGPVTVADPEKCGLCGSSGHVMDTVTNSRAPGGSSLECHDLTECGERAAVKP